MVTTSDDPKLIKFIKPIIVGAISGCTAVFFTNPFDLAKTRLQLQGELQGKGQYNKQLNGIMDTLIKTAKNEGFLSLQKGLAPAFVFQIIMNGIRLGMYDNLKLISAQRVKQQYIYASNVLCSGFVGFVGGFLGSPFNMIKSRMMLQSNFLANGNRYQYTGFYHALSSISKYEGYNIPRIRSFKGLFKGSVLWGIRTCGGSMVQLPAFDRSKIFVRDVLGMVGTPGIMLASAFSTLCLCVLMCPIDGLATRYLNQPFDPQGRGILYPNVFLGAKDIYAIEGFLGFYKGFTGLFARAGPHSFISLILFSHIMQKIQQ